MKNGMLPFLIKSYIPWFSFEKIKNKIFLGKKRIAPSSNSRYCYSVWLRHLSQIHANGLDSDPKVVAELGPGNSIGVGLMSLLTGVRKYFAFDVDKAVKLKENVSFVDELTQLLLNRENIPDDTEFPDVKPKLSSYSYPETILSGNRISGSDLQSRINIIKEILKNEINHNSKSLSIDYICPWYDSDVISEGTVDMIFSQAVLEHVEDLNNTYQAMSRWLKPGGIMSHQIDFKSHGTSKYWNGHWGYSDLKWKIIKGRRKFLINREPLSRHLELNNNYGFKIISIIPVKKYPENMYAGALDRDKLDQKFQKITENDFLTCSAYILSIKED